VGCVNDVERLPELLITHRCCSGHASRFTQNSGFAGADRLLVVGVRNARSASSRVAMKKRLLIGVGVGVVAGGLLAWTPKS
jgi:hypothetical protein